MRLSNKSFDGLAEAMADALRPARGAGNITITLSLDDMDKLNFLARFRKTDPQQVASDLLTVRLRRVRLPAP